MRSFVFSGLLFIVLTAALTSPPWSQETANEWRPLFNGHDLSGWSVRCKPEDREAAYWTVEDGAIAANSMERPEHDYVWLMSDAEYHNFRLRFKFQAYVASPGNSGVQIRSRYDNEAGWLDGPQIDIHPPAPWRTGMMWDETRGVQRWIFPDLPKDKWVDESMAQPPRVFYYAKDDNRWNEMEVMADGWDVKAWLNGSLVTDFHGEGILNDEAHQAHQVGETGHLAFQIHTGDALRIHFKDVEIFELP